MRYAYAITSALLVGGAAASLALQPPASAQVAQNEPGAIQASAPRAGAPMSFADMVARLQPAVVNISTTQHVKVPNNPFAGTPFQDFFNQMGQGQGGGSGGGTTTREATSLGSGFLISPDGYIVTNSHVISAGVRGASVDTITVTLNDRKEYVAKVIGNDVSSDLALLKIDARGLPFVRFGDSARARVGDWVIAIGQPFGIGSSVTAGIVSAVHRTTALGGAYDRFIQTDAAINQGNSGGPMFDMQGDVIGINSQILSPSGGSVGIGFAIPAEEAKPIIETMRSGGKIVRGYLGVGRQPIDDDVAAALGLPKNQAEILNSVEAGGPAAKAGLRTGDVITRINGQTVNPDQSLSYLVANLKPGAQAKIDFLRDGKPMSTTVTLGTRPSEAQLLAQTGGGDDDDALGGDDGDQATPQPSASAIGLTVQVLTPTIARQVGVDSTVRGVVISSVDANSDAGQKLKRGDVIIQANGTPTTTPAALAAVVAQAKAAKRNQIALLVQRGRGPALFIGIKLKS